MSKKCLRLGTENPHIEAVPKEIFVAYPGQDQIDTKVSQNTRFYNCNTSSQRFPHQSRSVRFILGPENFEILGPRPPDRNFKTSDGTTPVPMKTK